MIKILAVDDMDQWLQFHSQMLNTILQNTQYSLITESSATSAFKNIQNNINDPYNLIITDLQMELNYEPEHAGEWLIRNIKKQPHIQDTPIIIVSASYDVRFIAQKHNVEYISKPTLMHNPLKYEIKIKEALNI